MAVDRYGVMGYPISHSRSPVIHRLFALQTGEEIQYEMLQVAPGKLEMAVRRRFVEEREDCLAGDRDNGYQRDQTGARGSRFRG